MKVPRLSLSAPPQESMKGRSPFISNPQDRLCWSEDRLKAASAINLRP